MVFVVAMITAGLAGCRSTNDAAALRSWPEDWPDRATEVLGRPLPGPLAALYRMRVPSTGGLRLSVIAPSVERGRITVSEPFGAAVLVAGWGDESETGVYDLREGCRLTEEQAGGALGLGALPLGRAARLFGGRLPDLPGDEIQPRQGGVFFIRGEHWQAEVTVESDPWRVLRVKSGGYSVELDQHTSSVPGRLRVLDQDGDVVQIVLSTLKWEAPAELAPLPDLQACAR